MKNIVFSPCEALVWVLTSGVRKTKVEILPSKSLWSGAGREVEFVKMLCEVIMFVERL